MKKKFFKKALSVTLAMSMVMATPVVVGAEEASKIPTPVYFNNFESGIGDATIKGTGELEKDDNAAFGQVFHNAVSSENPIRTDFLLLPSDVIARAVELDNKELTVGFWVNVGTAKDYWVSPIFTAYGAEPVDGANTWPCFILQSRLLAQVNCAGWTNYDAADNVAGVNQENTFWLDDKEWHYYTATITETKTKIYIDGVIQNEWNTTEDEGHQASGLLTWKEGLNYICLGGNQAWAWSDKDPAYKFDDIAIWGQALTQDQISSIMAAKEATTASKVNILGAQTNGTSLGFVTTIDKAVYDEVGGENIVDMGVIVTNVKQNYTGSLTLDDVNDTTVKKIPTAYVTDIKNLDNSKTDDTYAYRSIITNVQDGGKTYTAVPYIKYKSGETEKVEYGAPVTKSLNIVK